MPSILTQPAAPESTCPKWCDGTSHVVAGDPHVGTLAFVDPAAGEGCADDAAVCFPQQGLHGEAATVWVNAEDVNLTPSEARKFAANLLAAADVATDPAFATPGSLIRAARRQREESRKALARRVGLKRETIRAIEAGGWPLSEPERTVFSAALGISRDLLVSAGSAGEAAARA